MNGIRIVVVSFDEARYLRKLKGKVYIGKGVNLYSDDGEIRAIEEGGFEYRIWNKTKFDEVSVEGGKAENANLTIEECEPVDIKYPESLSIDGPRKLTFRKLSVDSDKGFVVIDEVYDALQIYGDGELIADKYYDKVPYRIPAKLLWNKKCVLVMSELKDDIYIEP